MVQTMNLPRWEPGASYLISRALTFATSTPAIFLKAFASFTFESASTNSGPVFMTNLLFLDLPLPALSVLLF